MRINKYVAESSELSRRAADKAILEKRVTINDRLALAGDTVQAIDIVKLDSKILAPRSEKTTIILNKPIGYVCSRNGQGSKTIYDLLPKELHHLNSVGRLDKDSSGLLILTNDGDLAQQLSHPKYQKTKVYEVTLNKPLEPLHQQMISDTGVQLDDGPSKFIIEKDGNNLKVTMSEGRNRQIRRTFQALGYKVDSLHRVEFGNYILGRLAKKSFKETN